MLSSFGSGSDDLSQLFDNPWTDSEQPTSQSSFQEAIATPIKSSDVPPASQNEHRANPNDDGESISSPKQSTHLIGKEVDNDDWPCPPRCSCEVRVLLDSLGITNGSSDISDQEILSNLLKRFVVQPSPGPSLLTLSPDHTRIIQTLLWGSAQFTKTHEAADQTWANRCHAWVRKIARQSDILPGTLDLDLNLQPDPDYTGIVAEGGYSYIYRAMLVTVGSTMSVAVKVIRPPRGEAPPQSAIDATKRDFYQEVLHWSRLSHEHIMPLLGFSLKYDPSKLAIVLPWMENRDLRKFLSGNPRADRQKFAYQIADGLAYLHAMGLIHGDMKCFNVLVDDVKAARITDLGLIKVAALGEAVTSFSGRDGPGTYRWMAPELFGEDETAMKKTFATDTYAFAMTLYEMYTGNVPFRDIGWDFRVSKAVTEGKRPERPSHAEEHIKDGIWSIITVCWDAEATKRPTTREIYYTLRKMYDDDAKAAADAVSNRLLESEGRKLENHPTSESQNATTETSGSGVLEHSSGSSIDLDIFLGNYRSLLSDILPLPSSWSIYVDENGNVVFVNTQTNENSFDHPGKTLFGCGVPAMMHNLARKIVYCRREFRSQERAGMLNFKVRMDNISGSFMERLDRISAEDMKKKTINLSTTGNTKMHTKEVEHRLLFTRVSREIGPEFHKLLGGNDQTRSSGVAAAAARSVLFGKFVGFAIRKGFLVNCGLEIQLLQKIIAYVQNEPPSHSPSEVFLSFVDGLFSTVPPQMFQLFAPQELEIAVVGSDIAELSKWQQFTAYEGYSDSDLPVVLFWRCLESWKHGELEALLTFVAGVSRVPLTSFRDLHWSGNLDAPPRQFTIARTTGPLSRDLGACRLNLPNTYRATVELNYGLQELLRSTKSLF